MTDENVTVGLEADLDESSASAAADQFARLIESAFSKAAPRIAKDLSKAFTKSFKGISGTDSLFDGLAGSAREAATATAPLSARMEELTQDTEALNKRVEATRRQLVALGADKDSFAVIDNELKRVLSSSRAFNDNLERIADNPELAEAYRINFERAAKVIFRELGAQQSQLRNLNDQQRIAGLRANADADRVNQLRLADLKAANGRYIVETQGLNAKVLAETRIAGQRQIQQERERARTRIELVRFTIDQIKRIEKTVASVFRGTGSILTGAFRGIEQTVGRIGGLFRRSNGTFNEGLRGALLQRERSIDRSFERQTRSVRSSVREQSVVLERFEAQSSKGVFGALTGRSSLGTLIGGGAAIGGGFALFQGLQNGLKVGGDFVQGLAVLQAQLELTDQQMQKVREQSIELGNDIALPGVSALDAAQAIQIAAKQFAALGEGALPAAQGAARGILQLSRASGVSAEEAARVVGAAVNVFGIEASKATEVADQVTNALKNAAGVGFNDFADAFTQAASVVNLFIGPAQDANETLAETNAALAVLARGGIVGSDAGTSLKQFFLQANRGTADANEKLAEVADRAGVVGSVFFDASGSARTLNESVSILRRGLQGLSDQERNATLQKLFGSDAARAAAVLIGTTAEELRNLTDANLELGTAAEIAAAQNVGLRGALDALGSVIETQQIKTYEKYQDEAAKVVLVTADLLQQFFDGVGIFRLVRAGLLGIAVALGALVAVKTVAEGFQFLLIAMRGLLTPMGFLVTAVGALGAAFTLLREVSPTFRVETDKIGEALKGNITGALSGASGAIGEIARLVRVELLPRFIELGLAALRFVGPAIEKIGDAAEFGTRLVDSFMGALTAEEGVTTERTSIFGIAERLGLAVRILGISINDFFRTLTGQKVDLIDNGEEDQLTRVQNLAVALAEKIRGIASTAADAAASVLGIGDAILTVIATGDFSDLRKRIGDNFTSFGNFIVSEIKPELDLVVGFIDDFLSGGGGVGGKIGNSVQAFLLGPFQDAVRELGRFLGNLVTDPRLVDALEKLVGLAIITGANFIAGFGAGVASNLDELGALFGNQLLGAVTAGLKEAFSNPFTFAKIIALALVSGKILQAYFAFGKQGAGEAAKGFASGLKTRAVNGATFTRAFFGGPGFLEQQAAKEGARAKKQIVATFQSINRDLQRLGQSAGGRFGVIDQAAVDKANQRLIETRERLGEVGTRAVLARARVNEAFDGARQAVGGFVSVLRRDVSNGFADIRVGAGKMKLAIQDAFDDMAAEAGGRSQAIGAIIGTGIVSAVGAALAGQQLGGASSGGEAAIGLAGIISAALLPALTIPGPAGLAIGGLSLVVGGLTAAWQRNKKAAEEAQARVDTYTDILLRFQSVTEALPSVADQISEAFRNESDGVQDLALQAFSSAEELATIFSQGALDTGEAARLLGERLGVAGQGLDIIINQAEAAGGSVGDFVAVLEGPFGTQFREQLDALGINSTDFANTLGVIAEQSEALQGALNNADFEKTFNPKAPEATADGLERATRGVNALSDANDRYYDALQRTDPLQQQIIENQRKAAQAAQDNLNNISAAIDELNRQRTAGIQTEINNLTGQLDLARNAAQAARDNLTSFLSGDYVDTAREKLDDLVLSIPNLGSQLDDALKLTPTLEEAQVNQTLSGFGQAVSAALQKGIDEGLINPADPESVRKALEPFFTAVDELVARGVDNGGISKAAGDQLTGFLNGLLGSQSFDLLTTAVFNSDAEVSRLQSEIDKLNVNLLAKVYFDPAQIRQAASELGLDVTIIPTAVAPTATTADAAERAGGVATLTRTDNAAIASAVSDARTAAEASAEAARAAISRGATADTAARAASTQIDQINITIEETQSARATAQEFVLALGAAAGASTPTGRNRFVSGRGLPSVAGTRL